MKLKHIKVSNYRSFLGDHEFDVAEGPETAMERDCPGAAEDHVLEVAGP